MSWLTIESDPAVFSALISDLGVKDVLVEEVFSIDAASLDAIDPCYGFIFLFKYQSDPETSSFNYAFDAPVWFAHQIIQNACGTQAILACLLNSNVTLGSELSSFQSFTSEFPADLRGETMTNSDLLRTVHNGFSRSEMFHQEEAETGQAGEAPHHFIAYVRIHGHLYELDGLKPAPIDHGPVDEKFGQVLERVLHERVARYAENEVHFSLMALTKDPLADDGRGLSEQQKQQELIRREQRQKEVELRRHNFAGAIVQLIEAYVRTLPIDKLEDTIKTGKQATKARLKRKDT